MGKSKESVNHPDHYGGKDNPYEVIKIIEAHDLDFRLGNSIKYILRSDKKGCTADDLRKAIWYLNRVLSEKTVEETKRLESNKKRRKAYAAKKKREAKKKTAGAR